MLRPCAAALFLHGVQNNEVTRRQTPAFTFNMVCILQVREKPGACILAQHCQELEISSKRKEDLKLHVYEPFSH